MGNIYNYIFYILYKNFVRLNKKDSMPAFSIILILSICMFFNIISLLVLKDKIAGDTFRSNLLISPNAKLIGVVIIASITGINYLLLMYKHKDRKIILFFNEKFEGQKQNKLMIFLLILYIASSIIVGFYYASLLREQVMGGL